MDTLKDKVAIVTGGGSGIGRATCILLAKYGAQVALSDINLESVLQTNNLIQSLYPNARTLAMKCDVSSSTSVSEMIERTVEKFGRIDLAVNNAGILGKRSLTTEYPEEAFDQIVKVNLKGVFLCLKYEISQMLKQGGGGYSIVNTSSVAGLDGLRNYAPYSAVKHGVIGLTKSTALENSKNGIRINAICPAPIDTPMLSLLVGPDPAAPARMANARIPMARVGTPEEVAMTIVWLLSGASSFTTGAAMTIDGGISCL